MLQCCWVYLSSIKLVVKMGRSFLETQGYGLKLVIFNVRDTNILQQWCGVFCLHKRSVRQKRFLGDSVRALGFCFSSHSKDMVLVELA